MISAVIINCVQFLCTPFFQENETCSGGSGVLVVSSSAGSLYDALSPLALAVTRTLANPAALRAVAMLLQAGASPIDLMSSSPDLPESINGVPQQPYPRSALGLALMSGKVGFQTLTSNN